MEFLMTYGWAILAAVIAIGVLAYFGVFSPGKYVTGNAVVNPPFYINAHNARASTGVTLEIKNNGGEDYEICFTAGRSSREKIIDCVDPRPVVIDEIVGQLLALTAVPLHPVPILLSFLLFRFFDIFKPFPANWIDRHLCGGWGIMLDDVVAGLYAWLVLQLGLRLYGF